MKQDFDLAAILQGEYAELIVKGIEMTLQLALFAWLLAMVLALTLVTVRLTGNKLADRLVAGYVSYHRNVPTLVQLMLWYFGVPTLLSESAQLWLANHNTEYLFSVIALACARPRISVKTCAAACARFPPGRPKRRGLWAWVTCVRCAT